MDHAPAAPGTAADVRERLLADFVRLCETPSESRRERRVADLVAAELRDLGLDVQEDDSAAETGSDCGNLLARIAGPEGAPTILLCAHLDTVPLADRVEVERAGGVFRNRNQAILGADNKAAVAVLLAVARAFGAGAPLPVGLELLFTTCEELALAGAKAVDRERLRADYGYVFDHASPIGELVVGAPTYYALEARFHGQAAHAGIRPEDGRNAVAAACAAVASMKLGRLDEATTANAGTIEGGSAPNVVAERCRVQLEARSLDADRASDVASAMVDAVGRAASDAGCDVETLFEERFRGYRLARTARPVEVAAAALSDVGLEPAYVQTGGGSDANVFNLRGLPCVNVANGTERNHEPDESVSVAALETALDVALAIVRHAAA